MPEQLTRDQVPVELTWDLSHIYPSDDAWESDYKAVDSALEPLKKYAGQLGVPSVLLRFFRERDAAAARLEKVVAYASLAASADGRSPKNQGMAARVQSLGARVAAAMSFASLELIGLPEGTLDRLLEQEPELATYRKQLEDVERRRGHVLGAETERTLAALSETLGLPLSVWQRATATDARFDPIADADGRDQSVTIARWQFGYIQDPARGVRRGAYDSVNAGLDRYKNTLATTLAAVVKRNVTMARLRGYGSAVEMLLAPQRVPEAVYRMVLREVHDGIAPHYRRLVALRQRVLGIETMRRYDVDAPLDPGFDPPTTFEDSRRLIRAGLAPLGDEYGEIVEAAFRDRWVDRADNLGKRSGAFCSPVFGVHSYIFTTWSDRLRSTFVLAHELGHAGHGMLANRNQVLSNGKSITIGAFGGTPLDLFFVEAPSTANELLLGRHILATTDDARLRRFVISQFLGTFTHNMVTHMLEAHFEQKLYDLAEADRPITTQAVLDAQAEVFEHFYGGAVTLDEGARLYWAQQPHFYRGLYPYTYAAGLACAYNVAEAIRVEGEPAVDRWLETLRAGATLPPLELMAKANVDLTQPEPIRRAVRFFGELVDELERSFG